MAVVGIDLGTQSVKVAAVDDEGRVMSSATRPYAVTSPHPGWAETDPAEWLAATVDAADEVMAGLAQAPDAVGLSGQMHGVVACTADGAPLRPAITWADGRSAAQAARISAELGPAELARLGSAAFPGFAGPTLAWLADHEPAVLAESRWALQPKDWLRLVLTGNAATDPSDASGTLLYDIVEGRWSEPAMAAARVRPDLLAPITSSSAVGGEIGSRGGSLAGLPVVVGGADAACGVRGLGLSTGRGAIALGTGAQISSVLDSPRPDQTLRTHTFATTGDIGEAWYRLGAVQSGGLALERAIAWLGADTAEAQRALAQGISPSDPLFWPFVAGERSPYLDPTLRAGWSGLSLGTSREAMLRSVLEGMAYTVSAAYAAVCESGAAPAEPVTLLGGGSRDPAYVRLLATALDAALQPAEVGDATVVGAARLAGMAAGRTIPPAGVREDAIVNPTDDPLIADRRARWLAGVQERGEA